MSDIFNKNFWLATLAAMAIIVIWDRFFLKDLREQEQQYNEYQKQQGDNLQHSSTNSSGNLNISYENVNTVADQSLRISIKNNVIEGSLSTNAGRIDDISLLDYKETLDEDSPNVRIFSNKNTTKAYFFESGWLSSGITVPNSNTIWSIKGNNILTPTTPVILIHNANGMEYTKTISIDEKYLITVEDKVKNITRNTVEIAPFSLILRHSDPDIQDLFINHEGFVGYLGNSLERVKYKDTLTKVHTYNSHGGYLGFTDKYWLSALIVDKKYDITARFLSYKDAQRVNNYQADIRGSTIRLSPNDELTNVTRLFVGPKEYNTINDYRKQYSITKFEDTIDFGWFFFITKPMISFLLYIYHIVGNFGLAILLFTVIVRIIILPIAYKSYVSMAKMRELQPKMKNLKDMYGSDQQKYHKELMALYKKEQVNPLSGCLPILLQIPVFFSIYKVIFISIELRHAPFWGWIADMSSKDPTNILTLFGLIPINLPVFLTIGVWPILMGVTMYFQQKISNTQTLDGMQQKIMNMMPIVLVFVLASFPAGLVIYWTWSNILSIIQQYFINKKVHKDLKNKKNRSSRIKTIN